MHQTGRQVRFLGTDATRRYWGMRRDACKASKGHDGRHSSADWAEHPEGTGGQDAGFVFHGGVLECGEVRIFARRESSDEGGEMRERCPERLSASDCDMWVYDEVCKNESPRGGWIAYLVLAIVFILSALLYRYGG